MFPEIIVKTTPIKTTKRERNKVNGTMISLLRLVEISKTNKNAATTKERSSEINKTTDDISDGKIKLHV
jgi:hypothetical protein